MMKLIGPWGSGYTRRVGITLKLLGIPFEHLDWTGPEWREAIRRHSPMIKVPVLLLDDGEALVDSSAIIDHLYEVAGEDQFLLPASGAARRLALFHAEISLEIYSKQIQLYRELSNNNGMVSRRAQYYLMQAMAGFQAIEDRAKGPWLQGARVGHGDVMAVVAWQAALQDPAFADLGRDRFPRLASVVDRAATLRPFQETL